MKIDSDFSAGSALASLGADSAASGNDFAAALKQAVANGSASTKKTAAPVISDAERQRRRDEAARVAHAAVAKELRDYLDKTPAQHLREAVLKELGLSEESLQAMPPEQRQAKEAEINRRIRERMVGKEEGSADASLVPSGLAEKTAAPDNRVVMGADLMNLRAVIASLQAG